MSALRLEGVRVRRGTLRAARANTDAQDTDAETVFEDVSLDLAAGQVLALLGESGGGKSTLLKLANRLVESESGRVSVGGRPVCEWAIAKLRRAAVFVGQQPTLFGGSVADELRAPLSWAGLEASDTDLAGALTRVALDVPLARPGEELSGGQRTRLGVARALLLRPAVLLLDEPTGSLDVRTAARVLEGLKAWVSESGATLVCVTHRPSDLEALGGSAAFLLGGRLHGPFPSEAVTAGTLEDELVQAFLGALPSQEPA